MSGRLLAATLGLCAVGATWWEGLGVSHEDYARMPVEQAADHLEARLEHVGIEDLLDRCRLTVAAGWSEDNPHVLERHHWLICVVALRRMGASGEERWVEVLEDLYPKWRLAAYGAVVYRGATDMPSVLQSASAQAYRDIAHELGQGLRQDLEIGHVTHVFSDHVGHPACKLRRARSGGCGANRRGAP